MIIGTVIHGQKIGKKHGLPPTMNIQVAPNQPEFEKLEQGIYAVKVRRTSPENLSQDINVFPGKPKSECRAGVAHYGPRPAVAASDSFEIHVFDFNEDWYGASVEIEMGEYLRPIENFATIDELRVQIEKDIERGRSLLK